MDWDITIIVGIRTDMIRSGVTQPTITKDGKTVLLNRRPLPPK